MKSPQLAYAAVLTSGDLVAVDGGPVPAGKVRMPEGYLVDEGTARKAAAAVPAGTRAGRESRAAGFVRWCNSRGRIHSDPGAVADYAGWLADLGHPAETITAYTTTLASLRATSGRPLLDSERHLIRGVIDRRAQLDASAPDGQGDALQASECTRADLVAMLATLDRDSVRGIRDAFALSLHWHIAGRASEPAALNLRDLREVVAEYHDPDTGELFTVAALEVTFRLTKTNPYGRTTDVVRIIAQDDPACPVAAWRAWRAVLEEHDQHHTGPLLRRIDRHGRLGGTGRCAGRQPADPQRAGAIGSRTVRNLVRDCAAAAELVRKLEPDERALLSTLDERAELAAAADDAEREVIAADRRRRRRSLRRSLPRFSGHSMRRGCVRHLQRLKAPRHVIESHARYVPGSRALARYLDDLVPWDDNATVTMRLAAHAR